MEAVVAESFCEKQRKGQDASRVFLAGDSAHAFPPSGGFGLNTGIGDAFNLGHRLGTGGELKWKRGPEYSHERHHVAVLTKDFSLINYDKSLKIAEKLNLST